MERLPRLSTADGAEASRPGRRAPALFRAGKGADPRPGGGVYRRNRRTRRVFIITGVKLEDGKGG